VGDPAKAMQLLATLRNQNSISLTVMRDGQPVQLQYNIH
jgi:type II secretory pathway component PulC